MPRRITDEQELLDFINNRPSKKKKITIAVILIAALAALVIFVGVQIHKASVMNKQIETANAALEAGNYREAIDNYNIVIEDHSRNSDLYEGRADAYAGLKKYTEAIRDYHSAIEYDKSNEALYEKGVKAGLKAGSNKLAMEFINDMKTNIGEEKGEELRKKTFVYPAEKALNKKLETLRKAAQSSRDSYEMKLQAYTFFDINNDGVKELLTESGSSMSREKNLTIYAYRKGKVQTMLDRGEYGVVSVKAFGKTKSMELLIRGNGMEEYRYYKVKSSGCKKVVSSKRRSTAAGAYSDGQWTYYSTGEYDAISSSEYDKAVSSMKRGKARTTKRSEWKEL